MHLKPKNGVGRGAEEETSILQVTVLCMWQAFYILINLILPTILPMFLLSPFYRQGNPDAERLRKLPNDSTRVVKWRFPKVRCSVPQKTFFLSSVQQSKLETDHHLLAQQQNGIGPFDENAPWRSVIFPTETGRTPFDISQGDQSWGKRNRRKRGSQGRTKLIHKLVNRVRWARKSLEGPPG